MKKAVIVSGLAFAASSPLLAQDHSAHEHHSMQAGTNPAEDAPEIDHSQMDHGKTNHPMPDHSTMDHSKEKQAQHSDINPNTRSGPINAADAIWGAEAMQDSRKALYNEHGDMQLFWVQGDRLEYRMREGQDGYLWDLQGYIGGDLNKFWFKSEGEGSFDEAAEQAEIQTLYSRAIAPFFDLQAGVRHDFAGPDRTHAVVGVQGVMPYMFEVDVAAFLSGKGDLTARLEGEYDQRITDRLILQPRAEMNLSAQDIPKLGIGSGLDSVELGLRLRFEIKREFAPYLGIEQEWKIGGSKDFAQAAGEDSSVTNYVAGIRFWF